MAPPCTAEKEEWLEGIFQKYHKAEFIHHDPLAFVHRFPPGPDREIAGVLASGLAYGRVAQILANLDRLASILVPTPWTYLEATDRKTLESDLATMKHRWTTGKEMADLCWAVRSMMVTDGTLEKEFRKGIRNGDETILPGVTRWVKSMHEIMGTGKNSLLPDPQRGSACKRIHLFLRWMIRHDEVDPGEWENVSPGLLIVPLDTHMHRMGRMLGFTSRVQADGKTALEITQGFRQYAPDDPTRYDFALTRPGIRRESIKMPLWAKQVS